MQCQNNLKQFGLAVHNYHDTFGQFPNANVGSSLSGGSLFTAILPMMEQASAFQMYDPGLPLVIGCGGRRDPFERVAVEGTVTVDGQPLDRGMIRFIPNATTLGPKTTLNICDAQFTGDTACGPVAGAHRVAIEPDVSDRFPHDGEGVLEKLHTDRPRPERPTRLVPYDRQRVELNHTFVADELNRCEIELVSLHR